MGDQEDNAWWESDVKLLGFALSDCVIETDAQSAKYLRAVHRTALELATPNRFGAEIGGFWLLEDQLLLLRKLPEFYSPDESTYVARAVETYIQAQLPPWAQLAIKPSRSDQPGSS